MNPAPSALAQSCLRRTSPAAARLLFVLALHGATFAAGPAAGNRSTEGDAALVNLAQAERPMRTVPVLADYLPKPPGAAGGSRVRCTADALRTSADLGDVDEKGQPLLGLLRTWGRRQIDFDAAPAGCIDWGTVVRAWQQATGAPATGVLTASDLNHLADARMAHFARYRADLAAWQKERADEITNPPPQRPAPPPPELLAPRVADVAADVSEEARRVATLDPLVAAVECAFTDGAAGARLCKAAIESGRLSRAQVADAHYHLAFRYYRGGDVARALAHATASLDLSPGTGYVYTLRGAVYSDLGEFARALVDVDTALGLLQKDRKSLASAYAARAVIVGKSGNLRAARDDNEEALRLDPNNSQALSNRRVIRQRMP